MQHVVFGLADAFPDERLAPDDPVARTAWREAALDSGVGACLLRGHAADLVEAALLHFDGERYALLAWCVMPSHVHTLVAPMQDRSLASIVHSWKSFSANAINRLYSRSGRLWRREYYDHFIRDDDEFATARAYIERNPVAAKLVSDPSAWRWSSAWSGR